MRTTWGRVRGLLSEAVRLRDVEDASRAIQTGAARANARANVTVDRSGGMFNIFAKVVSGDESAAEEAMLAAADSVGWVLLSKSDKGRGTVWWFEPKPETKGPLSPKALPPVMWHTTPETNVAEILERGLVPRTRSSVNAETSRKYSPRVYLATSEAGASATAKSKGGWAMLRIDVASLLKSVRFYVDQEFGHRKDGTPVAVYTLDPIPASSISA